MHAAKMHLSRSFSLSYQRATPANPPIGYDTAFTEVPKTPKAMPDIQSCNIGIESDQMKITRTGKFKHLVWHPEKSARPALSMSGYFGTSDL